MNKIIYVKYISETSVNKIPIKLYKLILFLTPRHIFFYVMHNKTIQVKVLSF